ncbi:DsbC family protein [Ferrovum myxofaciens]|uniref:Thiol:disulfide interchange protein n=1 Tax=Ferrovum myxofaciens TaxID=416213 RepID=A0A9E6MWV7_9PROT|nr:DsbC family protein [Ferrovum myxofaciens]QKE37413.1 MAG: DsbC family protein [Ferrovum myxofaciens]QWY75061.1 MAG: DsbC family protein [Ferrovum myxofaciens]QWY77800.1 MAG: DsbC family protein [Ferrovum myxofaciens]
MNIKQRTLSAAIAVTLATSVVSMAHADDISDLKTKLHDKYPSTPITEIRHAPLDGLYEIDMGRNIAYTDQKAEFLLFGHIFNMTTQEDLTQKRLDDVSKVAFDKLPLDKAIKIVKGKGTHKFAVFSDPDCPYCKKLETSLKDQNDYTEYVFLFPIDGLHPGATAKAESIWCAGSENSRAKAWTNALTEGKEPVAKHCNNPIADDQKIGSGFGVQGTPTLINASGKLVPGAVDGQALSDFISGK